jgi:hypothetical protein
MTSGLLRELGVWGSTVAILVAVWLLIGFFVLTMPVAFLIWLLLGAFAAAVLYFSGIRFWRWGTGL